MRTFGEIQRAVDVAREAVAAGGAAALAWWRKDPPAEVKADTSPVSQADRESDAAILGVLRAAFPDHDVLSEESGARGPGFCDCRWIIDPLDGTRGFLRGDPTWGPLVALEYQGRLVAAAMSMPALGETWCAGRGRGCFKDGERVRVSRIADWGEARIVVGEMDRLLIGPHGAAVLALIESAPSTRCPGDLASCAVLLDGRAEVWLEAGVREWDLAAPHLLVEEAGGRFTDFLGRPSHATGQAVGSNRVLHEKVLSALRRV